MLKKLIFTSLLLIFTLIQSLSYGQYQNVLIGNQYRPGEVTIAIDPKNPNRILAGSNVGSASSGSGFYSSTNGGINWTAGVLISPLATPSGDPVVIIDTSEVFYFVQNSNESAYDRLLIMKNTNLGTNWISLATVGYDNGKIQDKPWACVDWSNSIWRNNIYLTWTEFSIYFNHTSQDSSIILFSKSTNGGLNWSQPVRLSKRKGDASDSSSTMEGAVPCTGSNGEIYVSWAGPIVLNSGQYAIFFNKSTDGGDTWLDSERVATVQPGGAFFNIPGVMRCNGYPVTCCDLSNGPHRGTIYINFSDQRNGIYDADVWLIKSTNGGLNWSSVKRVNNDPPGNQQFFNWMTIDQATGYLYFVFYDQRNLPSGIASVFIARSTDGGETFQNTKVNSSDFPLTTGYFMGDYLNISASNNHIRPIWTNPSGLGGIYTAIIDSFYYSINISHDPIQSDYDTSTKIIIANINSPEIIGTGSNAPRLYYKFNSEQFVHVNAYQILGSTYKFSIPGRPRGTKVYYYLAAQDSNGLNITTLPVGGSGINPPGTVQPSSFYFYEIYSSVNQCSSTIPKPINDLQFTYDTIPFSQSNKTIFNIKLNLTIYHPNDGDLIIQLKGPGGMVNLSQNNGSSGANYINTTFSDSAATSITQGVPPYTGVYKPQSPLSFFNNQPASAPWILRIFDSQTGNTGTLINWCVFFSLKNSVSIKEQNIPVYFELSQNFPNPFNPSTNIRFQIPKKCFVSLKVFDILGREIANLINEKLDAGEFQAIFNGNGLASGVYFYRLDAGGFSDIKKMMLIK